MGVARTSFANANNTITKAGYVLIDFKNSIRIHLRNFAQQMSALAVSKTPQWQKPKMQMECHSPSLPTPANNYGF